MKFYNNFPRNMKETLLYTLVVSMLAVYTITPAVNFCIQGISWPVFLGVLRSLPLVWLVAVIVLAATRYPVTHLKKRLTGDHDSYTAQITVNIVSNVIFMSMIMTIAGTWAGQGYISTEIFHHYLSFWPRNFGIAFAMQSLIAQPSARFVMRTIHRRHDKREKEIMAEL